jgi:hypothetical protein
MRSTRSFIVVMSLAVVMMRPSPAAAQLSSRESSTVGPPIAVGQKVSITTIDGRKTKGKVMGVSATTLDLGKGEVVTTSVAMTDVQRIQVADSVTNGVVTGALTVGLAGLLAGSFADAGNTVGQVFGGAFTLLLGGEPEPVRQTNHYLTGAVAGVAVGALLGYVLDADREKTIYERQTQGTSVHVRPIVSAAGKGVGVSVRW